MTAAKVPANKGKRLPPEPLTPEEVRQLIKSCSGKAATGLRNKALVAVLYRCGLRISEALSLHLKDIDAEAGSLRVLKAKGGDHRLVGIDTGTLAILQHWLDRRAQLGIGARAPIFSTLRGAPLKSSYCRELFPRLARRAGITKRCHPHGLRHSFAYELANEGVPLHVVQQTLGHRHLTSTQVYVNHLAPVAAVTAMRNREFTL